MGLQIKADAVGAGPRSDYYVAALRFIDPQLTPDSPLADVHTAAIGRRQELLQQPIRKSREDLQALDEALDYVRAYRLDTTSPTGTAMEVLELPALDVSGAAPTQPASATGTESSDAAAATIRRASGRTSLRDVMAQAQPADALIAPPAARAAPEAATAAAADQQASVLPETRAWPVLLGLLLILWQVWLTLFAGWTAARFLLWPGPGIELQLGWLAAFGLVALGATAAGATGMLVWRYRRRSRQLLMLVHLSAGFIALDLAAWRLAASDAQLLIDPPRGWYWLLLIVAWLIAVVAAWVHDLRVGQCAPVRE